MFGTVSAKNLNHGLRYPKEICKNFNNFPIAEYGKIHSPGITSNIDLIVEHIAIQPRWVNPVSCQLSMCCFQ